MAWWPSLCELILFSYSNDWSDFKYFSLERRAEKVIARSFQANLNDLFENMATFILSSNSGYEIFRENHKFRYFQVLQFSKYSFQMKSLAKSKSESIMKRKNRYFISRVKFNIENLQISLRSAFPPDQPPNVLQYLEHFTNSWNSDLSIGSM